LKILDEQASKKLAAANRLPDVREERAAIAPPAFKASTPPEASFGASIVTWTRGYSPVFCLRQRRTA
jgi:hypothetical protein